MMSMTFTFITRSKIIESCWNLLNSAKYVTLADESEFISVSTLLAPKLKSFDAFEKWKLNELNPQNFDETAINWIFLCDLLNFSFWKDENEPSFDVEFLLSSIIS